MHTTEAAFMPRDRPSLSTLRGQIETVTTDQTLETISRMIASRTPHYIATANVDFTALAMFDEELRRILLEAHLIVCDGMPLVWASRWLGHALPEHIAGSDLVPKLLALAEKRNWSVYFLGGQKEMTFKSLQKVQQLHPKLKIAGVMSPPCQPLHEMDHAAICSEIRTADPDLLFVSFDCPKQEKWIALNHQRAGASVTMGVGANIDFLVGNIRSAPPWMQRTGLEWLYCLLQKPRQGFKRYATDFAVFGLTIVKQAWLTRGSNHTTPAASLTPALDKTPDVQLSSVTDFFCPERLDAAEVCVIEQTWMNSLEGLERGVIIDCSGTQFIDSTGLGLLMRVQKHCRQTGKHLVLAAASTSVLQLLQITRLNSLFTQATSREEALNKILNTQSSASSSGTRSMPLQLHWSGAVTTSGVDNLWRGVRGVIQNVADSRNPVVIDLKDVQMMDSDGPGFMARMKEHAANRHIVLRFTNASPVVHETLHHAHMEHLLVS
jgi:N-acetylglucosaminyldiphosphoundecaprenol N-acetyl-beta-D-mannosaminyltransferase